LPFAQNFLSFISSFFVLVLAVVVTVILLFNLDWLYPLFDFMANLVKLRTVLQKQTLKIGGQKLKIDKGCENEPAEEDVLNTSLRTMKRRIIRRRRKRPGFGKMRDFGDDIV